LQLGQTIMDLSLSEGRCKNITDKHISNFS
jgi:hypothetical protein